MLFAFAASMSARCGKTQLSSNVAIGGYALLQGLVHAILELRGQPHPSILTMTSAVNADRRPDALDQKARCHHWWRTVGGLGENNP
jgi:hypothetical protein